MNTKPRTPIAGKFKARDMLPGDVIELSPISAYHTAMVESINEKGDITVIRPYQTCADFDYGNGEHGGSRRIIYTGYETFTLHADYDVQRVYSARND